jgi:hypothetical protein
MLGALMLAVAWRMRAWQETEAHVVAPASPPSMPARDDSLRYPGPPYHGALVEVRDEALQRLLPDVLFFEASYPVGVLVSLKRTSSGDEVRSCSLEDRRFDEFFAQFVGIRLPHLPARRQLAFALAKLLADLHAEGRGSVGWGDGRGARAEIWLGDLHWRAVEVTADDDGRVSRIAVPVY